MKQKLVLSDDIITGFSYSFTSALLAKIKELEKENRIFEQGLEEAKKNESNNLGSPLTLIAESTLCYLNEQIRCNEEIGTPKDLAILIRCTEEFLAIFAEK